MNGILPVGIIVEIGIYGAPDFYCLLSFLIIDIIRKSNERKYRITTLINAFEVLEGFVGHSVLDPGYNESRFIQTWKEG